TLTGAPVLCMFVAHACGSASLLNAFLWSLFFFFQAEDGIRDWSVTGVQTCALPILLRPNAVAAQGLAAVMLALASWQIFGWLNRSEERRVGKECRSRGAADA